VDFAFEVQEIRAIDREHALARVRVLSAGEELATVTAIFTVTAGRVSEVHRHMRVSVKVWGQGLPWTAFEFQRKRSWAVTGKSGAGRSTSYC
jgi:hypothetical protein